jgi:hypothetical protein
MSHLTAAGLIGGEDLDLWDIVTTLAGSRTCALEPDVMGGHYLTRFWRKPTAGPVQPVTQKLLCAWDLSPYRCAAIIARTVSDFPEADAPPWWMDVVVRERFAKDRLNILVMYERAIRAYAKASQLDRMASALSVIVDKARAPRDFDQIHNHLSTVMSIAVHTYGSAGRWREMRDCLEQARELARRFPAQINLHPISRGVALR